VEEGLGVYGEATCVEFHQLLVAALHAYRTSLRKFREAHKDLDKYNGEKMKRKGKGESHGRKGQGGGGMKQGDQIARQGKGRQNPTMAKASAADSKRPPATPPGDPDKLAELQGALVERAQLLWQCTYLLWRIAYSHMFPCHLALLQKGQWLHMPNQKDAGQPVARAQISPHLAGEYDKHGVVDAGEEGGSTAAERVQVDQEAGQEEADQEFRRMHRAYADGETMQSIYSWWARLQVTHLQALDILSAFGDEVATLDKGFKINLLAVRHSPGEMEPWEAVVEDLAAQAAQASTSPNRTPTDTNPPNIYKSRTRKQIRPFDGQATATLLKEKIDEEYERHGNCCHAIFKAFNPPALAKGTSGSEPYIPRSYARMHCKGVLSALMKCLDDAEVRTSLKEHAKVRSCLMIVVFIYLIGYSEPKYKRNSCVKAMLCNMLGALAYPERRGQGFQRSWPSPYRFSGAVATLAPSLCSGADGDYISNLPSRGDHLHGSWARQVSLSSALKAKHLRAKHRQRRQRLVCRNRVSTLTRSASSSSLGSEHLGWY
jgi:hypothetical protein